MHFHMSLSRDLRWICSILIWIDSQKIELRAEPKISWSPLRKLAVLNITKTNKRIRMFHTRVTNVSLDIDYWSHFVEYPDLPVACCLPHLWNSVHEHSWFFFNVWVFVRTSTNFVHLASFQKKKLWTGPFRKRWTFLYDRQVKTKFSLQNTVFCNCCWRTTRTRYMIYLL